MFGCFRLLNLTIYLGNPDGCKWKETPKSNWQSALVCCLLKKTFDGLAFLDKLINSALEFVLGKGV